MVPLIFTATGLIFVVIGLSLLICGFIFLYLRYRSRPYNNALSYFSFYVIKPSQVTITVQKPAKAAK